METYSPAVVVLVDPLPMINERLIGNAAALAKLGIYGIESDVRRPFLHRSDAHI